MFLKLGATPTTISGSGASYINFLSSLFLDTDSFLADYFGVWDFKLLCNYSDIFQILRH